LSEENKPKSKDPMEISFLEELVVVEEFDLERLPGNPRICETVAEFLMRNRKFVSHWPPGIEYECKKCGECCTWNFIIMNMDEELTSTLRKRAKYPHGSWIVEEDQVIMQMPGFMFRGNIP